MSFKNRVFGCAVVRAINANYNADFSHQPRTLPNGKVYATDKAFKYLIRNYWKDFYSQDNKSIDKVFYFTRYNANGNPLTLDQMYKNFFGDFPKKTISVKGKKKEEEKEILDKNTMAKNLLSCLDIRCFGATYAGITNISLHGTTQINPAVNLWSEDNIFSEQIKSPFADGEGAEMTTLGRQFKLQEGHYCHHFSINPKNLEEILVVAGEGAETLSKEDVEKLKNAFRMGATYFDSASKAGIDNELLFWVQLKEDSKKVLPTFGNLVKMRKKNEEVAFDFSALNKVLEANSEDIESVEIYYLSNSIKIKNTPSVAKQFDIISGKEV